MVQLNSIDDTIFASCFSDNTDCQNRRISILVSIELNKELQI
ncbi:MAG: hypothetical protein BWY21_01932 [Parcubacteria group bacterium ADurb.Bin216]|nr:MAG: hypothetical protein BWY21_01932 [Parcubacteria group bacterium ADurb.Bin216]